MAMMIFVATLVLLAFRETASGKLPAWHHDPGIVKKTMARLTAEMKNLKRLPSKNPCYQKESLWKNRSGGWLGGSEPEPNPKAPVMCLPYFYMIAPNRCELF